MKTEERIRKMKALAKAALLLQASLFALALPAQAMHTSTSTVIEEELKKKAEEVCMADLGGTILTETLHKTKVNAITERIKQSKEGGVRELSALPLDVQNWVKKIKEAFPHGRYIGSCNALNKDYLPTEGGKRIRVPEELKLKRESYKNIYFNHEAVDLHSFIPEGTFAHGTADSLVYSGEVNTCVFLIFQVVKKDVIGAVPSYIFAHLNSQLDEGQELPSHQEFAELIKALKESLVPEIREVAETLKGFYIATPTNLLKTLHEAYPDMKVTRLHVVGNTGAYSLFKDEDDEVVIKELVENGLVEGALGMGAVLIQRDTNPLDIVFHKGQSYIYHPGPVPAYKFFQ